MTSSSLTSRCGCSLISGLLVQNFALRGPDEIRCRKPHLVGGLEVRDIIQVDSHTVRPVLSSMRCHLLNSFGWSSDSSGTRRYGHRRATPVWVKASTMSQKRPDRAGHFVGHRDDRHVHRPSREHLFEPRIHHSIRSTLREHHAAGTVDQQRSQVRIAALADPEHLHPSASARLPRDQAQECHRSA